MNSLLVVLFIFPLTVLATSPVPLIYSSYPEPTNATVIDVIVVFDATCEGNITLEDFLVTGIGGTLSGGTVLSARISQTWQLTPNGDGVVSIQLLAGACTNPDGGQVSQASGTLTRTIDHTPPSLSLVANPVVVELFTVIVQWSENVLNFGPSTFEVDNGVPVWPSDAGETSASWLIAIAPLEAGDITITVPEGVVADKAGNKHFGNNTLTVYYDKEIPNAINKTCEAYQTTDACEATDGCVFSFTAGKCRDDPGQPVDVDYDPCNDNDNELNCTQSGCFWFTPGDIPYTIKKCIPPPDNTTLETHFIKEQVCSDTRGDIPKAAKGGVTMSACAEICYRIPHCDGFDYTIQSAFCNPTTHVGEITGQGFSACVRYERLECRYDQLPGLANGHWEYNVSASVSIGGTTSPLQFICNDTYQIWNLASNVAVCNLTTQQWEYDKNLTCEYRTPTTTPTPTLSPTATTSLTRNSTQTPSNTITFTETNTLSTSYNGSGVVTMDDNDNTTNNANETQVVPTTPTVNDTRDSNTTITDTFTNTTVLDDNLSPNATTNTTNTTNEGGGDSQNTTSVVPSEPPSSPTGDNAPPHTQAPTPSVGGFAPESILSLCRKAFSNLCDCNYNCDFENGENSDNCGDCMHHGCTDFRVNNLCEEGENVFNCFPDCVTTACDNDGICEPENGESTIVRCADCPASTFCNYDGDCAIADEDIYGCPHDCDPDYVCKINDECDFNVETKENCPWDCSCTADDQCQTGVGFWENPYNCVNDCVLCTIDSVCHIGLGENNDNCAEDCKCNFNGVCDGDPETPSTCPTDCPPPEIFPLLIKVICPVDRDDCLQDTCSDTSNTFVAELMTILRETATAGFQMGNNDIQLTSCVGDTLAREIRVSVHVPYDHPNNDVTDALKSIDTRLLQLGVTDIVTDVQFIHKSFEDLQRELEFTEKDIGYATDSILSEDTLSTNIFLGNPNIRLLDVGSTLRPEFFPITDGTDKGAEVKQYIIVLQEDVTETEIQAIYSVMMALLKDRGSQHSVRRLYLHEGSQSRHAQKMLSVQLPVNVIRDLRALVAVLLVEHASFIRTASVFTQANPPWHLDRIDAQDPELDRNYLYQHTGEGVRIYVVDTGVYYAHQEFGGRVQAGFSAFADSPSLIDENGHGTHVAGLAAGKLYGVAKNTTIVAVKAIQGDVTTLPNLLVSINWIIQNHLSHRPISPSVMLMSLTGPYSAALSLLLNRAEEVGLHIVVAAGNHNENACNKSPSAARRHVHNQTTKTVLTVGSTSRIDQESESSNWGPCVDILAPGEFMISAAHSDEINVRTLSGTSAAAPLVAGVYAKLLQSKPVLTPAQARAEMIKMSTKDVIQMKQLCSCDIGVASRAAGCMDIPCVDRSSQDTPTPNRLLFSLLPALRSIPTPPAVSAASVCGDGKKEAGEACDDMNFHAGDGCDNNCQIESSTHDCTTADTDGPATCSPICPCRPSTGSTPSQMCFNPGFGACAGYVGSKCQTGMIECRVCGDGIIATTEECDDGNNNSEDGCTDDCAVEPGYICLPENVGAMSICSVSTGTGIVSLTQGAPPRATSVQIAAVMSESGGIHCGAFLVGFMAVPSAALVRVNAYGAPYPSCVADTVCTVIIERLRPGTTYRIFCVPDQGGDAAVRPAVDQPLIVKTSSTSISGYIFSRLTSDEIALKLALDLASDVTCAAFESTKGQTKPSTLQIKTATKQTTAACVSEMCAIRVGNLNINMPYKVWCLPSSGSEDKIYPSTDAGIQFVTNTQCKEQPPTVVNGKPFDCTQQLPMLPIDVCVRECIPGFKKISGEYTCNIDGTWSVGTCELDTSVNFTATPSASTTDSVDATDNGATSEESDEDDSPPEYNTRTAVTITEDDADEKGGSSKGSIIVGCTIGLSSISVLLCLLCLIVMLDKRRQEMEVPIVGRRRIRPSMPLAGSVLSARLPPRNNGGGYSVLNSPPDHRHSRDSEPNGFVLPDRELQEDLDDLEKGPPISNEGYKQGGTMPPSPAGKLVLSIDSPGGSPTAPSPPPRHNFSAADSDNNGPMSATKQTDAVGPLAGSHLSGGGNDRNINLLSDVTDKGDTGSLVKSEPASVVMGLGKVTSGESGTPTTTQGSPAAGLGGGSTTSSQQGGRSPSTTTQPAHTGEHNIALYTPGGGNEDNEMGLISDNLLDLDSSEGDENSPST